MNNAEGVVLKSIKVFESEHVPRTLKSWLKIYLEVLALIFILFSLVSSHHIGDAGVVVAFLLAIIFAVIIAVSKFKKRADFGKAVEEISLMKFKLGDLITADIFQEKIKAALPKVYGDAMTFNHTEDKVIATYEGVTYEIILNGDGTFSVVGKNPSLSDKELYKKIREIVPLIVFWYQHNSGLV